MQLPDNDVSVEELVCNRSFQRYCLGTNDENHMLWEHWIQALPERAADIEEAKKLIHILSVKQGSRLQQRNALKNGLEQHEALDRLLSSVPDTVSNVQGQEQHRNAFQGLYRYAKLTAAAIVVLVSGYFIWQAYSPNKESRLTSVPSTQAISSGISARKTLILSDGSVITLNKNSEIRLAQNFNSGQRELWLTGEAFLDVKHNPAHPFIVHTSFNDIKVLGTSFNVKTYPNSRAMETTLISGSVQVNSTEHPENVVLLKPNQKLVADNSPVQKIGDNKVFKVLALDAGTSNQSALEIQWVRKRLHIQREPLSTIAQKLEAWYGIEVVITDDRVKNYRYSGTFENETIIKTLEALQLSYPFEFKTEQNRIIISK